MLNIAMFYREVGDLMHGGQGPRAEEPMLKTYSKLKSDGTSEELEIVACQLAQYYSMPDWEDMEKAEMYFLECEALLPGACTKRQTASFSLSPFEIPQK